MNVRNTPLAKQHLSSGIGIAALNSAVPPASAAVGAPGLRMFYSKTSRSADDGEQGASITNGQNRVYRESDQAFEGRTTHSSDNCENARYAASSPTPEIPSTVGENDPDNDFDGSTKHWSSSPAWYAGGSELPRRHGSNGVLVGRCFYTAKDNESHDQARSRHCRYSIDAGIGDHTTSGSHKAYVLNHLKCVDAPVKFHMQSMEHYTNADSLDGVRGGMQT